MSTDIVIVAAARTAVGKFGGTLAKTPAPELGAAVIANLLERAKLTGDQIGEVILGQVLTAGSGQNPARQAVIKSGLPQSVPGADDQRGLRLGPEGGDARRAGDPRRRLRDRHRRRPGEHEPGAARAARLARGPAHGRLEDGRLDDHRRPLGRLQQVPHGHHGRERRQEVRRQPREAGRARARLAAEGRRGAGRRPLQGRDRAVLDRAEEGRPDRLRRRRVHQQEDQRRGARRPAARVRQGRHGHRRQRLGPQRRRRRRRRHDRAARASSSA